MGLLRFYLANEVESLVKNGVRLRVIGRRDRLPNGIADAIADAETTTADGDALNLRIAIDYSARDAILNAAIEAATMQAAGARHLTRETFTQLVTGEAQCRDVDLIIRTSGEKRLSDFLLWESAYAEFYFTETMWPDFAGEHLADALSAFHGRQRRYGSLRVQECEPVAGQDVKQTAEPRTAPPVTPDHEAKSRPLSGRCARLAVCD
jgi:undecaprenyl diphosphate synthase